MLVAVQFLMLNMKNDANPSQFPKAHKHVVVWNLHGKIEHIRYMQLFCRQVSIFMRFLLVLHQIPNKTIWNISFNFVFPFDLSVNWPLTKADVLPVLTDTLHCHGCGRIFVCWKELWGGYFQKHVASKIYVFDFHLRGSKNGHLRWSKYFSNFKFRILVGLAWLQHWCGHACRLFFVPSFLPVFWSSFFCSIQFSVYFLLVCLLIDSCPHHKLSIEHMFSACCFFVVNWNC